MLVEDDMRWTAAELPHTLHSVVHSQAVDISICLALHHVNDTIRRTRIILFSCCGDTVRESAMPRQKAAVGMPRCSAAYCAQALSRSCSTNGTSAKKWCVNSCMTELVLGAVLLVPSPYVSHMLAWLVRRRLLEDMPMLQSWLAQMREQSTSSTVRVGL